jgi:thiol:disulfide interchange protein
MTTTPARNTKTKRLKVVFGILLVVFLGYFANKAIQTYLGQQALDDTGLTVLSLKQALNLANNSDKLVLADMSAIWCPTCRKLDNQIFANQKVKTALELDYVYARVEYGSEEGQSFMKKYGVMGFPTLLVINKSGEKLARLPLTFEPAEFVSNMQQVVDAHAGKQ